MRWYDTIETPKTGKTFLEDGDNRLPKTDERVAVYFQSIDKVKYDRGFDSDGYPILLEYALQEDGTRFSKYNVVADEEGVYQPDFQSINSDSDTLLQEEAKSTRDTAEISDILVHEVMWQVRDKDRERIKETIDTAYRQGRELETIGWILADDSIRPSTVKDLEEVLDTFSVRREDIFTQYAIWRNGARDEAFEYVTA